jgi:hypothetical protein
VTSVGDIEIELAFRIAIRGRMCDLAELTRTLEACQAVILLPVKERPGVPASEDKRILVSIGRVNS